MPENIIEKTTNPKVSIIMPVYNTEKFLIRCLNSIVNQTYKNFELICVDDKSQDNSLCILNEYARKYENIKVIANNENKGQGFCKNIGLEIAKGDYISFVDSDDFISLNFIEEMLFVAINEKADITMSNLRFETKEKNKFNDKGLNTCSHKNLYKKLSAVRNGSCCDKIFSTRLIKKYQIFFPEGIFYEDNDFLLKTIYWSNKLSTTNKCTYFACYNPDSTTRSKNNLIKLKISASKILNNILEFYSTKNITKNEYEQLVYFCLTSFCGQYIEDDDFILPSNIEKEKLITLLLKPKYKNIFQKIFSLINITRKTKILTICFIPIRLRRRKKGEI